MLQPIVSGLYSGVIPIRDKYQAVATARGTQPMGAGVIPFAVLDSEVFFLFQKTFTGRKVGHLIDFGGGLGAGEDYQETAIREFV